MAIELAAAYLSIVPEMRGVAGKIQAQIGGVSLAAAGQKLGGSLTAGIAQSIKATLAAPVSAALEKEAQAAKALSAAEGGLAKQRAAQAAAQAKVTQAEERLAALRASGKASAGDLQAAEAALEAAKLGLVNANRDVANSEEALTRATQNATSATNSYNQAVKQSQSLGTKMKATATAVGGSMQQWGAAAQTAGGAISSLGGTLTSRITKPALGAATAVGGLIAGLGFKRLVGIDTARGQFKGLGLDADKVMKQVDKGVNGTALSMAQGASAAVGILATGNMPLKGLEAQIKRVANVSAAYNVDAEQANYLLNNVLTKNKVTYGDLSQMVQNGIPIISDLAKHYGVSGDAIEKMAGDGKISIEDLNKVLDKSAGSAAEEYAKTWKGVTANITSNLGKLGAKALGPSFEIVKAKLGEFLALLKSPQFGAAADAIGVKLAGFLTDALNVAQQAISWWQQLDGSTKKMIGGFAAAAIAAGPMLTVIGGVLTKTGGLVGILGKVVSGLGGVSGAGGTVVSVLRALTGPVGLVIAALVAMWTQSETFRNAVMELGMQLFAVGQQIMTALAPVLAQLAPLFGQLAAVVGDTVGMILAALMPLISFVLAQLVPVFSYLAGQVASAFKLIISVITPILSAIQSVIKAVMAAIKGDWSGAWGHIKDAVGSLWTAIKALVVGGINHVKTIVTDGINLVKTVWANTWSAIGSKVTAIWSAIKSTTSSAINSVKSTISSVVAGIKSAWSSAWNSVKTKFDEIWSGIKTAAKTAVDNVYSVVTGIKTRITGFFSGAINWLKSAGENLVRGLWNGITSLGGWIRDKVAGFANSVTSAVQNAFTIHSPSKQWRDEVGRMLTKGLALGITDGLPEVKSAIAKMSEQITKAGETAIKDEAKRLVAARRKANADIAKANKNRGKGVKAKASLGALSMDEATAQAKKNLPQIKAYTAALQVELKKQSKLTADLWDDGKYSGAITRWKDLNAGTVALLEGLKANGKARAEASDAVKTATLVDIGKAHGEIVGALDTARKTLKELQDASAQLQASISSSLTGELDLKGLVSEDGPAPTFDSIKSTISTLLGKIRRFVGLLDDLRAAGIPGGLIQEVAALGTTAGIPIAEALKTGSKKQIKDLSGDWISLGTWADKAGKSVADSMYKVGIQAQQGLIKGLESDKAKLEAAAARLADTIVKSAKQSLGIKSPAKRIADEVGRYVPLGAASGIDSELGAVRAAATRMADAAIPDLPLQDWTATSWDTPSTPKAAAHLDTIHAELALLRQALSELVIVDAGGQLITRMRVEARREIADVVTMAGMRR